jgi:hypothetical protein
MEILYWTLVTLVVIIVVLAGFLYVLFLAHCKVEKIHAHKNCELILQSDIIHGQLADMGPWPMLLDIARTLTTDRQLIEFEQYVAHTYPVIRRDPEQWDRVMHIVRIRYKAIHENEVQTDVQTMIATPKRRVH